MQNSVNKKNIVTIIYPKISGELSPEFLTLCELFISSLLPSKIEEVYCQINSEKGYIESNDSNLKNILHLVLRGGKIEEFYRQFMRLLHKTTDESLNTCMRTLRLLIDNSEVSYCILEEKCFPNFKWKIRKIENVMIRQV